MDNKKGDSWTVEHLNSPAWGTDLILRKKDGIDDVRIHLTDIRDYAVVTEVDQMICWEYDGVLWIEDKYATTIFHIAAQKHFLENLNVVNFPNPVTIMARNKLEELEKRKVFLEELMKSGTSPDLISWTKLDILRQSTGE